MCLQCLLGVKEVEGLGAGVGTCSGGGGGVGCSLMTAAESVGSEDMAATDW